MTESKTYEGKTEAEWLAEAAASETRKQESWERSDTDGFMSQWASGVMAQEYRAKARMARDGGFAKFPALFDTEGNLVAAKLVATRFGDAWALLASDDPGSKIVGWVNRSKAAKASTRAANMRKKGYAEGVVRAPAGVRLAGKSAVSVGVETYRRDGGFSRDVEVVSVSDDDERDW